ncbi:MAG: response regulator [Flavobacteriales bacterium]|nr:response regulator [Flavobacteriales bacterium]
MADKEPAHFNTIFIVDDEKMFQEGAKGYLSSKHKEAAIHCYGSGEDAIANLSLKPDLVVLDHHLAPEGSNAMNGLQTLQKMKEEKKTPYVVILTAEDNVQVANDTMEHGAFDYIVKGDTAFAKLDINCAHILKQIGDAREIEEFKKFRIGFLAMIAILIATLYFFTSVYDHS